MKIRFKVAIVVLSAAILIALAMISSAQGKNGDRYPFANKDTLPKKVDTVVINSSIDTAKATVFIVNSRGYVRATEGFEVVKYHFVQGTTKVTSIDNRQVFIYIRKKAVPVKSYYDIRYHQ